MAMGVAEVIPGVSGGTIAFVTGIYDELVATIARLSPAALVALLRHPGTGWREYNLGFLAVLGGGMVCAVLLFARALGWLLATMPTVVWGYFFGLIAASVVLIGRARPAGLLATFGIAGLIGGAATALFEGGERVDPSLVAVFAGGAVAVCAWILPAVSGSFLLLTFGLYEPVLAAVARLDLAIIGVFVAGCATGLMLFSRLLAWLMRTHREPLLAFLTGFMAGAIAQLWPWQFEGAWFDPAGYAVVSGEPARLIATLCAVCAGGVSIWLLARFDR
jgi:putative membrane protein